MEIKEYCNNRRLEMLKETQSLENKRNEIVNQGQVMQNQVNHINAVIAKNAIELEILDKLEADLSEEEEC